MHHLLYSQKLKVCNTLSFLLEGNILFHQFKTGVGERDVINSSSSLNSGAMTIKTLGKCRNDEIPYLFHTLQKKGIF